jgi:hypothetical protein
MAKYGPSGQFQNDFPPKNQAHQKESPPVNTMPNVLMCEITKNNLKFNINS